LLQHLRMAMKTNLGKCVITSAIILVNLLFWIIPSDLAYSVAQERDILLGRYTIDHFTTLLLLILASVLVLCFVWSKKKKRGREDLFRFIAVFISVIISIVIADIFLRLIQHQHYVRKTNYYHRVPNMTKSGIAKDVPKTAFSYPVIPPGYSDIEYTLTVDKRGFRNKTDLDKYDVVVLGDSFTEGSNVSDEQVWPVLFAKKSNLTVYNLGMSGGSPVTYLETLKRFGLGLSPKMVVCMLYEGNDFRAANFSPEKSDRNWSLRNLLKTSPLRQSIMSAFIRYLGPINCNRQEKFDAGSNKINSFFPSYPLYAVSWLPLAIPDGPEAKYYAFKVKRLLAHFISKDDFLNSGGVKATFNILGEVKKMCDENNIRMIIMYAPDKPHIILPLVSDKVSPEKLRAFMALKEDNLPPNDELMETVLKYLSIQETVFEEFCRRESIEFAILTEPLCQKILEGRQAYFTYDQHWTPIGQEVAANTLYLYIKNNQKEKSGIQTANIQ